MTASGLCRRLLRLSVQFPGGSGRVLLRREIVKGYRQWCSAAVRREQQPAVRYVMNPLALRPIVRAAARRIPPFLSLRTGSPQSRRTQPPTAFPIACSHFVTQLFLPDKTYRKQLLKPDPFFVIRPKTWRQSAAGVIECHWPGVGRSATDSGSPAATRRSENLVSCSFDEELVT